MIKKILYFCAVAACAQAVDRRLVECSRRASANCAVAYFTATIGVYDGPKKLPPAVDPACTVAIVDAEAFAWLQTKHLAHNWQLCRAHERPYADNVRAARFYKVMLHAFVNERVEYVVWLDCKLRLDRPLDALIGEMRRQNKLIGVALHDSWNGTLREAREILKYEMDDVAIVNRQLVGYRDDGFPLDSWLADTRLLVRRHGTGDSAALVAVFNRLWHANIRQHSRRDQLSFNKILWEADLEPRTLVWSFKRSLQFAVQAARDHRHIAKLKARPPPAIIPRSAVGSMGLCDSFAREAAATGEQNSYVGYVYICHAMLHAKSVLVFGLGYDSVVYSRLSADILFVENVRSWIGVIEPQLECTDCVLHHSYTTKIESNTQLLPDSEVPLMQQPVLHRQSGWDFILVDAPFGSGVGNPGRFESTKLAGHLLHSNRSRHACLHDTNRPLERQLFRRYIGHYTDKMSLQSGRQEMQCRRMPV